MPSTCIHNMYSKRAELDGQGVGPGDNVGDRQGHAVDVDGLCRAVLRREVLERALVLLERLALVPDEDGLHCLWGVCGV